MQQSFVRRAAKVHLLGSKNCSAVQQILFRKAADFVPKVTSSRNIPFFLFFNHIFNKNCIKFLKLLPQPQKVEKDPNAVYKKELAKGVALFQSGEYVKALSRFLVLQQLHPDHKAEIEEWMMKCTVKMNDSEPGGGETLRRDPVSPTPPKPTPTPAPRPKIGKEALLLVLIVALAFIFLPKNCKGGGDAVDLGLSVKWANCNVGASGPSDYGDYFAWGETRPKSEYTRENSVTEGKNLDDIGDNARYDAARANWGGNWRLPTKEEFIELKEKCTWMWTTQGGHKGYKVTGPSGKSIFLPAAGWHGEASLYGVGGGGYYWGSTPGGDASACRLYFSSSGYDWNWSNRYGGRSVRPVSD